MNRYPAVYSSRGTIHHEAELEEIRRLLPDDRPPLSRDEQRTCFEDEFQDVGLKIHLKYFSFDLLPGWQHSANKLRIMSCTRGVWSNQQINVLIHPSLTNEQAKTNGHSGKFPD